MHQGAEKMVAGEYLDRMAIEAFGPGFYEAQWYSTLIGVLPEHRRKGVAKNMMKVVEERVRPTVSQIIAIVLVFVQEIHSSYQAKADGASIILEATTEIDVSNNAILEGRGTMLIWA
ncbi:hypothetical protein H0H92_003393 [Tricholoma furcatifolium]|nr:hypothetical protein H0H92_003393 [Tricholoma furcatifolium]